MWSACSPGLSVSAGQVGKGSGIGGTPHFEEQYTDLFSTFTGFFGALLLCDPLCAASLKEQGYDTKAKLIDYFYKHATQTAKEYRERNWSYLFEYGQALKGVEPFATWYKLPDDTVIPKFPHPERIAVIVIGRPDRSGFPGCKFQLRKERLHRQVDVIRQWIRVRPGRSK